MAIVLLTFLSACASYTETHTSALNSTNVRYGGFSEFDYLEIESRTEIEIGPASPSYNFEEGRSFFVSVRVPEDFPKYINLTSRLIGQWIPTSHIFYPMTLFLDGYYKIVRKDPPSLAHNPRFMKGLDFDSQIEIPVGARFIVFHSIPEAFGQRVPLFGKKPIDGRMVGVPTSGGMMFFMTSDPASSTAVGPTGRIWLEYTNEKLELPLK